MNNINLKKHVRVIPDFPKKGISFKDITTLLKDKTLLNETIRQLKNVIKEKQWNIDAIAGIESRGFILGSVLAHELGTSFVPIRKKGKLPFETYEASYEKEYGPDFVEMHKDALMPGQRVLVVDDLLATGGTAKAAVELIKKSGASIVGTLFLIELEGLKGRDKLGCDVASIIKYDF